MYFSGKDGVFLTPLIYSESDLVYQSCVFYFFASYFVLRVVLIHLSTIVGGLTTEEFKNLLEKA